jgi:hypothetical protein
MKRKKWLWGAIDLFWTVGRQHGSFASACRTLPVSRFNRAYNHKPKLVEAAGVEPDTGVESTQLIDSGNARIGMISEIAKSAVRSLYGHFPDCPQHPNSTFGRPLIDARTF